MLNDDYFRASDLKYKKIWLVKVEESALRTFNERHLSDLVKSLCQTYKINYREVHKLAVEEFNKKITFYLRLENTFINMRFRWFVFKWKWSKFFA